MISPNSFKTRCSLHLGNDRALNPPNLVPNPVYNQKHSSRRTFSSQSEAIPCFKGKNLDITSAFFPVHAPSAQDPLSPGFKVDPQPHPLLSRHLTGVHHFHLTCMTTPAQKPDRTRTYLEESCGGHYCQLDHSTIA